MKVLFDILVRLWLQEWQLVYLRLEKMLLRLNSDLTDPTLFLKSGPASVGHLLRFLLLLELQKA